MRALFAVFAFIYAQATLLEKPTGDLHGHVVQVNGQSAAGIPVYAWQASYRGEQLVIGQRQRYVVKTNEKGEYRFSSIEAGEYIVEAGEGAVTFYPGVVEPSGAEPVMVRKGGSVSANMQLAFINTFKVSGRIIDSIPGDGAHRLRALYLTNRNVRVRNDVPREELGGGSMIVTDPTAPLTNVEVTFTPNREQFEIRNVRPGSYDLFAIFYVQGTAAPAQNYMGRSSLEVVADLKDVVVEVRGGIDVEVRGTVNGSLRTSRNTPYVFREDFFAGPLFKNVPPGTYRFWAEAPPQGYVADIRQGGRSVYDSGFEVGTHSAEPLEVSFGSPAGVVQGSIEVPAGVNAFGVATVTLAPELQRRQNPALYKTDKIDRLGEFTFTGIAPGEYKLFVFEDPPSGAAVNPAFLARHESLGVPVTVSGGTIVTMRPPLIPMP